jgi:hypothetical protein
MALQHEQSGAVCSDLRIKMEAVRRAEEKVVAGLAGFVFLAVVTAAALLLSA